jgi:hypothetical protein
VDFGPNAIWIDPPWGFNLTCLGIVTYSLAAAWLLLGWVRLGRESQKELTLLASLPTLGATALAWQNLAVSLSVASTVEAQPTWEVAASTESTALVAIVSLRALKLGLVGSGVVLAAAVGGGIRRSGLRSVAADTRTGPLSWLVARLAVLLAVLVVAFMLWPGAWSVEHRKSALAVSFAAFGVAASVAVIALVFIVRRRWSTTAAAQTHLSPAAVLEGLGCLLTAVVLVWACSAHFHVVALAATKARAVG